MSYPFPPEDSRWAAVNPNPGALPPAPPYGYLVPTTGFPPGPPDPLVTPPGEGVGGWFTRLFNTVGRSWKSLLLIAWATQALPLALYGVIGARYTHRLVVIPPVGSSASPRFDTSVLSTVIPLILVVAVAGSYLSSVGQAATVRAITGQAAGRQVPLGAALGYGFRHGLRVWGWSLLYGLIMTVGLCACLLPGLYLALAGCLYTPVALYRRGMNPISTSFSLVNRNFGAALGRMVLLVLMVFGVRTVLAVPSGIVSGVSTTAGYLVTAVVDVVTAPLALLLTVGTVLLFAEVWARQQPTSTAELDAALG